MALAAIGLAAAGLVGLALPDTRITVPAGARAGELSLRPCTYATEAGDLPADCGELVVAENRDDLGSRLIALPVVRVRATGVDPAEPVFRLAGGPGQTNMVFPMASRLVERHDVVLVGYRGVDGSSVLDCPEVESAVRGSADLVGEGAAHRTAEAFAACSRRLAGEGVDLRGYTLTQRVEDLEDARRALGHPRIDLLSQSAGTRTAMVYSWRRPQALHRSAMIGVNPPGHFLWDPAVTDAQIVRYAELCRLDAGCAARTDDLAATLRATAADVPGRWGTLPVKAGAVRAATLWGLFETTSSAAPLNAPATLDAWLTAAEGDPSGLWAISIMAELVFPGSFVWGESAATAMTDAAAVDAYYGAGGDPGTILGNAGADFLLAGGLLTGSWPVPADAVDYREPRPSAVRTLLVSGELDVSTPPAHATTELLPTLPDGDQVVLAGFGHVGDFWREQPEAGRTLLTTFFDTGAVDDSGYRPREVGFDPGALSLPTVARVLLGTLLGAAVSAAVLLGWMVRRVRRGGFGPRVSVAMRIAAPVVLGLGAWSAALLVTASLSPATFLGSPSIAVPVMAVAAGLGVHLAGARRGRPRSSGPPVLAAALAGSGLGALAADGFPAALSALAGAVLATNLALIALDVVRDHRSAVAAVSPTRRDPVGPGA
ncbi:alpha/beta hydrolase [Pseudonocardia humida]|uniref:Alpha/beta hydrolase n=1 Tax=Pseudonocardia humida TaxID=2800819 RepID=A0ABT1A9Q6_9PSEU|nr:alpha/beta hydrolase [Pseudonocardia humida]MCO1659743.1 alpha/beta hydrolase [Pseudonocardia humida]